MVTYINSLPANYYALVGIKGEGSYELTPPAYIALQSLGMDTNTKIDYRDGFAMAGQKGAAPGSVMQRLHKRNYINNRANIE